MKYDRYIQEAKQTHKKAIFEARRVRQTARLAAGAEYDKGLRAAEAAVARANESYALAKAAHDKALAEAEEAIISAGAARDKALAEADAIRRATRAADDNALVAANEKYAAAVIGADAELQRVRGLVHGQAEGL